MQDLRIAMVGCGQIANAHLKAIEACPRASVSFCVDIDEGRAEDAAQPHDAGFSARYDDALDNDDVDAVVLCLPHNLHLGFTVSALMAGKHVLVEKPMALNEAEAREMVSAAEEADRHLMVGQSTRFLPSHQEAKSLIQSGRIGEPLNYSRQTCFWVERLSTDWRRDTAACGGLYLPLFGSHDVDAMLWLLDDTPNQVSSTIRSGSDLSEGDVDGWIGLNFADGKVGSISFSLRSREVRRASLIVGTEGTMLLEQSRLSVDGEEVFFDADRGAFERQMDAFVTSIREGVVPAVPGTDGVRTMRVLGLAREASEQQATLAY